MPGESAQARAVKGEGADARLAKHTNAPRVLCAGIIVLDNIGVPKIPVKSALFVIEKGEPSGNVRPYPCHSCAAH